jgi:hypothetical protein
MSQLFIRANKWLLAAAILSLAATALHLIVGTPELMHPVYNSAAPAVSIATVEVMWNGIALLCVVTAAILLYAAVTPDTAFELSLAVLDIFVGMTALFFVIGYVRFGEFNTLPQWQFFGLLPILITIGLARRKR